MLSAAALVCVGHATAVQAWERCAVLKRIEDERIINRYT